MNCTRCTEVGGICQDCEDEFYQQANDEEWTCCFPGRCCMPGFHMASECHTAEMMGQMIEEGEA